MPRAVIEFECQIQGCKGVISDTIWVSEPDYGAERMSDGDAIEDHDLTCPECDKDYEIQTVNGLGGHYATLDGETVPMDLEYAQEPDDYDDFLLRYQPGGDPQLAFNSERNELLALLVAYRPQPDSMLSRMIYSQFIAIMEAYLSDKVLQLAMEHPEIKKRLATGAGFVQNQNLKLSDVLLDPSKAENTFKVGLQSLLYHDLEKVEKLYKVAFQKAFWPANTTIQGRLEAAVKIRHDCVHRNGSDMEGTVHQFGETVIHDLATDVGELVTHLEDVTEKAIAALPAT